MQIPGTLRRCWRWSAERRSDCLWVVLLAGLTLAAYGRLDQCDFVNFDDPIFVTENPQVRSGLTSAGIRWAWGGLHAGYWQPLTWMSLQLDAQCHGLHPAGFHRTNVVLHLLGVLLLYAFLKRLIGRPAVCAFAAAVWAVHPLHVESVAWISERKDVLSTPLWLGTLLAYLHHVQAPRPRRYLLVLGCFFLGLLAKPMLVSLPCVLLLLDYWPLGRLSGTPGRRWPQLYHLVREKVPLLLLAVLFCALTLAGEKEVGALAPTPLGEGLRTALAGYGHYLSLTLWPRGLAVLYPLSDAGPPAWQVVGCVLVLAAVTWLVLRQARRRPYLAVGWLWFVGTLIPVCGIVQQGPQAWADRYTYVPHIGLLIMLAGIVCEKASLRTRAVARAALAVGAAGLVLVLGVATWRQTGFWRDSATLWARALAVTTDNWVAHNNYGDACMRQGRIDEAARHFVEALRIWPNSWKAHANLGEMRFRQGRPGEARTHLLRSVELGGGGEGVLLSLGALDWREGKADEALQWCTRTLQANPDSVAAHNLSGVALLALRRAHEAEQHFRLALRLSDQAELHSNLGAALFNQGKRSEAIGEFQHALRVDPAYAPARAKLAVALRFGGPTVAKR